MTVRLYASTDASAPVLNGQADSLNALLLACLVDGYGSQPAAGWTSPYYDSASKTRVFKTAGSPSAYLQVLDNGQSAGGLKEARLFGWETMSAYNAGAGQFPTTAQRANGYCIRKSATADTTARAWWVLADDRRFYFFVTSGDLANTVFMALFGAFQSYKPGDNYAFAISGRLVENVATYTATQELCNYRYPSIATTGSLYLARSYTGVGGSVAGGQLTDSAKAASTAGAFSGAAGITFPNPADGGLYLAKTYINETNVARGELPGIWNALHARPINHLDTFTGTEGLSGRDFLCLWTTTGGCVVLETSDTWDD